MRLGGNAACLLNAANEVAVEAFLNQQIGFTQMSGVIEHALEKGTRITTPSIEDYCNSDAEARRLAANFISQNQ